MNNITLQDTIVRLVREYEPMSYLEIGCYDGRSLRWVVENAAWLQRVCVCDTWDGPECRAAGFSDHSHIDQMLDGLGCNAVRRYLDGQSHDLLPSEVDEYLYDLILVDGDHSEMAAFVDLLICWKLLMPGGWLVMDDTNHVDHPYLDLVAQRFHQTVRGEVWEAFDVASPPNPPCGHVAWRKRL